MKPVVVGMKMKPQGVLKTKKGINVLENKTSPAGKRVKMSSPSSVKGAKSQAEIDKEIKKETIKAASSCVRQFSSPISSFVEPAIIQTLPTGPKTLNVTKPTGAKISNGTGGVKTLNIRTGDKSINVTVKPVKTRVGRTIIPSERAISASITRAIVEAEPKYIDHIEFMKKEKGNKKVAKKVKIEQSKDPPQVEATEPAITEFKLVKKLKVEPEIKLIDTGKVAAANNDSKPLPKSINESLDVTFLPKFEAIFKISDMVLCLDQGWYHHKCSHSYILNGVVVHFLLDNFRGSFYIGFIFGT